MTDQYLRPALKIVPIENAVGGYCDPLTGECYPAFEKDVPTQKENLMTTAIDPVCKMEVEIETAQYKSEHAGEMYYFCSPGCQRSFEKDPHKYLPQNHHGNSGHDHDHEGHEH
jgi:YHS domain-containing protein